MKSFVFIFALLFLASFALSASTEPQKKSPPAHKPSGPKFPYPKEFDDRSSIENINIAVMNPLFKEMAHFGVVKVAQKLQSSAGIQFAADPRYKVTSTRTAIASGLEVTFDVIMEDVYGGDHEVTFTVIYQAWKNYMGLENTKY